MSPDPTRQMGLGEHAETCPTCRALRSAMAKAMRSERVYMPAECAPCHRRHEREAIREFGGGQ